MLQAVVLHLHLHLPSPAGTPHRECRTTSALTTLPRADCGSLQLSPLSKCFAWRCRASNQSHVKFTPKLITAKRFQKVWYNSVNTPPGQHETLWILFDLVCSLPVQFLQLSRSMWPDHMFWISNQVRQSAEKFASTLNKTLLEFEWNIPLFDYGVLWDVYGFLWDVYGLLMGCRKSGFYRNMGCGWVLYGKSLGFSDMNTGFYGKNMGYPYFFSKKIIRSDVFAIFPIFVDWLGANMCRRVRKRSKKYRWCPSKHQAVLLVDGSLSRHSKLWKIWLWDNLSPVFRQIQPFPTSQVVKDWFKICCGEKALLVIWSRAHDVRAQRQVDWIKAVYPSIKKWFSKPHNCISESGRIDPGLVLSWKVVLY